MPDPTAGIQEIDLGAETSFPEFPAPLTLQDQDYFLAKGKDGVYRLLSTRCPHRWGEIIEWDTCFMCPDHGWRFERGEGICINGPRSQMYSFIVTVRDGNIFARIPEDKSQWS